MPRVTSAMLAVILLSGCFSTNAGFHVETQPQGLEVQLMGYRFLLHDVYGLDVRMQNAGDGVLYKLNDIEILIITGREVFVNGKSVNMQAGDRAEILPDGQVLTAPRGKVRETAPTPESILRKP